jgi:hypothetical protein
MFNLEEAIERTCAPECYGAQARSIRPLYYFLTNDDPAKFGQVELLFKKAAAGLITPEMVGAAQAPASLVSAQQFLRQFPRAVRKQSHLILKIQIVKVL